MYPVRKNESVSSIKCDRIDNMNGWSAEHYEFKPHFVFPFFMFFNLQLNKLTNK